APALDAKPGRLEGVRVALCLALGDFDPDPAVVTNTLRFGDALRAAGAPVDEVELPWTREGLDDLLGPHFHAIMGASIEGLLQGDPAREAQLMPYTRAFIGHASRPRLGYVEGIVGENEFFRPLGELFERYDALVCPTTANTGFTADDPCTDTIAM